MNEVNDEINTQFNNVVNDDSIKAKQDKTFRRIMKHLTKELSIIYDREDDDLELRKNLLKIYKYIVGHIPIWNKQEDPKEAEYVDRNKEVLNWVFYDTDIVLVSGETTADCTKRFREFNERRFGNCFVTTSLLSSESSTDSTSSPGAPTAPITPTATPTSTATASTPPASTTTPTSNNTITALTSESQLFYKANPNFKNISGRKIDIKVIIGGSGVELCCLEFKIHLADLLYNQCKSIRLNKCVVETLAGLDLYDDEDHLKLIGMDWIGSIGYIYTIEQEVNSLVIKLFEEVKIPDNFNSLTNFETTLVAFYKWRDYLLDVDDRIKQSQAATAAMSSQSPSPSVFQSPKTF